MYVYLIWTDSEAAASGKEEAAVCASLEAAENFLAWNDLAEPEPRREAGVSLHGDEGGHRWEVRYADTPGLRGLVVKVKVHE